MNVDLTSENVFLIVILILLVIFSGYLFNQYQKEIVKNQNKKIFNLQEKINKPLLRVMTRSWRPNPNNTEEYLYDVTLFNYGMEEAENITIGCGLFKENNESFLYSFTNKVGNIASQSAKRLILRSSAPSVKLSMSDKTQAVGDYTICFAISCNDCILLNERIPLNKKYIKEIRKRN